MNDVAKNIRKIRTSSNMTQEELAEKMYVTRQTISNWENGKSQPDVETLKTLAGLFHVDVSELIYGKKDAYPGFQKKYIIAAIISLCVVILCIVLEQAWYKPMTEDLKTRFANTFMLGIFYYTEKPILLMAIGVFFLAVLSFGIDTRLERRTRITILIIGIVLAVLSFILIIHLILLTSAPRIFGNFMLLSKLLVSDFPKKVFLYGIPFAAGCALFLGCNRRAAGK